MLPKKKSFGWCPSSPSLLALMQSPVGILVINWVFQGVRGMQQKELTFRIMMEVTLIAISFFVLPVDLDAVLRLGIALIVAHTINWLFNTHLWVCVRYFPIYHRNPEALGAFLVKTEVKLRSLLWLDEAVCIGSVGDSGRIRSERSDIDLRLIFGQGVINWIRVNLLLLKLRTIALLKIIPLDLYAYDNVQALERFRQDEGLRVILDRQHRIQVCYEDRLR